MYYNNRLILIVALLFGQHIIIGQACSVLRITPPTELVAQAYAIVRVKAVNYAIAPGDTDSWTTGIPDSVIRFEIEEVVKGKNLMFPNPLLINGYLSPFDDFNDGLPPYTFVRSNGQYGSCFANTYKQNGSFLLFLNNQYSPYHAALAPVNEQLHLPVSNDEWFFVG